MVKRLGFYEENLTISGPVSGLLFFVFVLALILRLGGGAKKITKRRKKKEGWRGVWGVDFAALLWAIDFCILT